MRLTQKALRFLFGAEHKHFRLVTQTKTGKVFADRADLFLSQRKRDDQ